MPFAEANGLRLFYEEHGAGDPLLLIMGLATDHVGWMLQVPAFSERYRTIVYDNRDVGQSAAADGPYEIADMAADALALADELGLDTFHVLGVSMGGAIAQELALSAPERVRSLQLAVTWGGSGRYGIERARLWASEVRTRPREDFLDSLLLLNLSEQFYESPDAVAYARKLMHDNPHPQDPEAFVRQAEASGRHETRDRLHQLSMPAHVISGEYDVLINAWKQQELAELIPDAKLTVIPRAPHGANMERAQEFNAVVLEFLTEHADERVFPSATG
ncbi:MAG: alpha/beta hydrolase [Actinomycetota bacterium]|nr:alpha/beta hydrolase [Actinomycetota bacterium]